MKNNSLRKILAGVGAATAVAAGSLAIAPQAEASTYGWVYVSTPTWQGNCNWGNNGRVTKLWAAAGNTWSVNGDSGDDLVYAKVRLGENQAFSYTAFCNKWPGSYQPGVQVTIRPTRNNQTVWVGPAGVRYN